MKNSHSTNYWPQLDGVRSFAFLLVFISHVGAFPETNLKLFSSVINFYNLIVTWGWVGVDLFLVLSGFLITSLLLTEKTTYGNISFKLFFMRRMLRIWPLYYLLLVVGFFILPLVNWMGFGYGTHAFKEMFKTYFLSFLFFFGNLQFAHVIKKISPMIAILWTACLEEQFYVIWGSLLTFLKNRRQIIITILILISSAIIARYFIQGTSSTHNPYYYNTFTHMDPLLLGCFAAVLWSYHERKFTGKGGILCVIGLSIILTVMLTFPDIFKNDKSIVLGMSLIGIGWTLFLLGVLTEPKIKKFLSCKPLVQLGKITYGMYLLHYPIWVSCSTLSRSHYLPISNPIVRWIFNFFVTFFITLLAASLSFKYFEKPFNDLRRKYTRKYVADLIVIPAQAGTHA